MSLLSKICQIIAGDPDFEYLQLQSLPNKLNLYNGINDEETNVGQHKHGAEYGYGRT